MFSQIMAGRCSVCIAALMQIRQWSLFLYTSLLGVYAEASAWHVCRGYLVDTGQEFINSREPGTNTQPFEFDTGMGVLPEAIDMSGSVRDCSSLPSSHSLLASAVTRFPAAAAPRSVDASYSGKQSRPDHTTVWIMTACFCSAIDDTWRGLHHHQHQPVCL